MNIINVCLVGAGSIGMVHADTYIKNPNIKLTVVETEITKIDLLSKMGITVLTDLKSATNEHFDLFDICLPTHLHMEAINGTLSNSDAYVMCEKPIVLNTQQMDVLTKLPGVKDRLLCAFVERFNDPFVQIKEWSDRQVSPIKMEFKRRTKKPLNSPWFSKPELGGDILLDLGIHDIDLSLWFTDSRPVSVSNHEFADNNHESFDLTFQDGSLASFYLGWDLPENHAKGIENIVSVQSSTGSIRYLSESETLAGDIDRDVRPRFPLAYENEINEALLLASTGAKDISAKFPSLDQLKAGIKSFGMIAKDRSPQ